MQHSISMKSPPLTSFFRLRKIFFWPFFLASDFHFWQFAAEASSKDKVENSRWASFATVSALLLLDSQKRGVDLLLESLVSFPFVSLLFLSSHSQYIVVDFVHFLDYIFNPCHYRVDLLQCRRGAVWRILAYTINLLANNNSFDKYM